MTESKKGAGDFGRRRRRQGRLSCYKPALQRPGSGVRLCFDCAAVSPGRKPDRYVPSKDRVGAEARSK